MIHAANSKLHPIVNKIILCEKQNIAMKSHRHDASHVRNAKGAFLFRQRQRGL